jgi:hypothetical protein
MPQYLDVAVVGIQRYLGRTPDLKGRRGASAWLSEATDRDRLRGWVAKQHALADVGVEVNPEAGEADGVVPLRMPTGIDARAIAEVVIGEMCDRLPGLELRAVWGTGPFYVEAYRAWMAAPRPDATLVHLPPIGDFPPLESCGQCRVDPALKMTYIHENRRWLCADCLARYDELYRWPGLGDDAVPVAAERALLDRLGRDRSHAVSDFAQLAALGGEDGNRNHLATVFADGNAIGTLFGQVIADGDPAAKQAVSQAVSQATRDALTAAAAAVLAGDQTGKVPVIPHVVGGDDLLVSVVADRAWRFVTEYLREFSRRLAGDDRIRLFLDPVGGAPGASAGVVFAHSAFPFPRAVELAEQALRAAKHAHAGRASAVTWLDVTREGEQPPPDRMAWTLDDLDGAAPALADLRAVPPAGRAVLERLIDPEDAELSAARLREHARRLGRDRVLDPFLGADGAPTRLADALALVRWWR